MCFAVLYFLSLQLIIISFKKGRIYTLILALAYGAFKRDHLSHYIRAELLLNSHSQRLNHRSISHNIKVRSYHITIFKEDKSRIELKEFRDYEKAKEMLDEISSALSIEKIDRIALIKSLKRQQRRR